MMIDPKGNVINGLATLLLVSVMTFGSPAEAGKGDGKGKPGGDTTDNVIRPVTVTFQDAGTAIASDGNGAYVDAVGGVEAFIGSQANTGNVILRTERAAGRGLWLDFSRCVSADPSDCRPMFLSQVDHVSSLKVDANDVLGDGIYSMEVGGFLHPPMRVYYRAHDGQTRFVDFNSRATGGSPCRGAGAVNVEVERTSATSWVVRAPGKVAPARAFGCASSPVRSEGFQGLYEMPFEFTVVQNP